MPDLEFVGLDGRRHALVLGPGRKGLVVAVTSSSCPVSGKFAPVLARLEREFGGRGVDFVLFKKEAEQPKEFYAELPINPLALAISSGYTFVGRGYALNPKATSQLIAQAVAHRGTSFIDIVQTCPVYNDLHTKEYYAEMVDGKPRTQITTFVVEARSPGVEVTHRCQFMGLHALYNAVIRFTDVRVPRANIVGGEGRGLKVALSTLNAGRLSIPASSIGVAKRALAIAREWGSERIQWGVPIGQHQMVQWMLADMAIQLDAARLLLHAAATSGDPFPDITQAAKAKIFAAETANRVTNDALQCFGRDRRHTLWKILDSEIATGAIPAAPEGTRLQAAEQLSLFSLMAARPSPAEADSV